MVTKKSLSALKMAYISLGAVLIALCSWISVPATVPFTLQTFAVLLVCDLLGGRWGLVSVLLYLLMGAVGFPVFSGFSGGLGHLLGMTGGFSKLYAEDFAETTPDTLVYVSQLDILDSPRAAAARVYAA